MTEMDIDIVKQVGFRLTAVGFSELLRVRMVTVGCLAHTSEIGNMFMVTSWNRLQAYLAPEPQDCVYLTRIPNKWNELCISFRAMPCVLESVNRSAL
jgi:hypothetical protein